MTSTTYQNNYVPVTLPQHHIRQPLTINRVKNSRPNVPLQSTDSVFPTPAKRTSLPTNVATSDSSILNKDLIPSQNPTISTDQPSIQTSKRTYTFSNPPREVQRQNKSFQNRRRLSQRVSSAPDEYSSRKSSYSPSVTQKPLSANSALTPRSYDNEDYNTNTSTNNNNNYRSTEPSLASKRSQQEKESLENLIKQEKKSKVPELVQRRRKMILFCRDSSQRGKQTLSPVNEQNRIETKKDPINQTNHSNETSPTSSINLNSSLDSDSSANAEADFADSKELAAILAQMQLDNDCLPSESSSKSQSMDKLDLSKYDYIVASPNDTTAIVVSPRTIKADEELASRIRFLQNCRNEMSRSANAKIPTLMASVISDMNATLGGTTIDNEPGSTLKSNTTEAIRKQSSLDNVDEPMESSVDNEFIPLCYDATLKRFYDPNTGKYYELI